MTVQDIIYDLRHRLNDVNETGKGEYSDEDLLSCSRNALRELCGRSKCFITKRTVTTNDISVPLENIYYPFSVSCDTYWLNRINPSDASVYYDPFEVEEPKYFFISGTTLYLHPSDANNHSITITGYGCPSGLSSGDSIDFIPSVYFPTVIKIAEIYARESRLSVEGNNVLVKMLRQEVDAYFQELFI